MSKGVAQPAAERRLATVVGMSWMEAVLHTTNIHSPSEATPGVRRAISREASSPRGVAALPSPSRLADRLADTAAITSSSPAKAGKSRRRRGRSSRASFSLSPERRMTSMTPIHRQSSPAMDRHSSTASAAPLTAAAATASVRPVTRAHRIAATNIPTQSALIATAVTSLSEFYLYGKGRAVIPKGREFFVENHLKNAVDNLRLNTI